MCVRVCVTKKLQNNGSCYKQLLSHEHEVECTCLMCWHGNLNNEGLRNSLTNKAKTSDLNDKTIRPLVM